MEMADAVVVVSPAERDLLAELGVSTEVFLVSNAHDLRVSTRSIPSQMEILFVANFHHAPNEDGLAWFLKEVHPLITKQLKDARLKVIGTPTPLNLIREATTPVTALGWVDNLAPHYAKTRVVVAPLRFGAGVKGKIGEAWSHGVPVVMTHIGAEGMLVVHGETGLVTDDPEEFADHIIQLLQNEERWLHLSRNSITHVREHFSIEALRSNLGEIATLLDCTSSTISTTQRIEVPA